MNNEDIIQQLKEIEERDDRVREKVKYINLRLSHLELVSELAKQRGIIEDLRKIVIDTHKSKPAYIPPHYKIVLNIIKSILSKYHTIKSI